MDIIAHLINHILCSSWLAHHFYFLTMQIIYRVLDSLDFLPVLPFFIFSVESNESPQNFIASQIISFLFHLLRKQRNMVLQIFCLFLQRLIVADDRFIDFLFEIREKSLNNNKHLTLGFPNFLFKLILLFGLDTLLLCYFFLAISELFDNGVERFGQVINDLLNTILNDSYFQNWPYVFSVLCSSVWTLMQVGHKGSKHQGFLQKLKMHSLGWNAQGLGLQRFCSLIEQKIIQRRSSIIQEIIVFLNKTIKNKRASRTQYYEMNPQKYQSIVQLRIYNINSQSPMKGEGDESFSSEENYYQVQKILDVKEQKGKKYYLVKWLGWDIKTCTWEEESNISHLKQLIKEFHNSKKYDQQRDLVVKRLDVVQVGMSPYEQTKVHGHVLYGDQPSQILEVTMIEKNNKKIVHFLVEWKQREDKYQPYKSLIQSSILFEHYPLFAAQYYQSKIQLITSS